MFNMLSILISQLIENIPENIQLKLIDLQRNSIILLKEIYNNVKLIYIFF